MILKNNKKISKTKVIESNFDAYFDEIHEFCEAAEKETTLEKTRRNMKSDGWENCPESLLYRLYKSRKYDNGNGIIILVYDDDGLYAFSGAEIHNRNIIVIAKRLYVLRKYRTHPIFSTFMIRPQIEWAKKKGAKACIITVNEYQRNTVLRIFKRGQKRRATVLGHKVNLADDIYKEMVFMPCKMYINGEYQYITIYKIDKNYNFTLEAIK